MQNQKYTEETVLWVKHHTSKHLSFAITRPEHYRFNAGQFARLGFREGNGYIWRAYSMTSAEYADHLEYFAILIENGPMSAHFAKMKAGDPILLDKTAQGFFLPERFPDGKELIMLATGSGIAPFLSIIQQPEIWQRFPKLVLAHSVSYQQELIFNEFIHSLANHPLLSEYSHQLTFIPITTRETNSFTLHNRLPELLKNHQLSQACQFTFTTQNSRFMLCGNPQMVQDTFKTLLELGFSMHRNKTPGQIMMENGF